jgi:hypothetical protein
VKNERLKLRKMKNTLVQIAFLALLTGCQTEKKPNQLLADETTRKEIISLISNDATMHKQMMTEMMDGKNGMEMMMDNHESMMKMMKENPIMMKGMMDDMMAVAKTDTSMSSSMCKTMMDEPKMMEMMDKMKHDKMDMNKMKGKDSQKPVDHSKHQ